MQGKMKVAVMTDIMKMGFVQKDIPQPRSNEALVKLEYIGVCGSDLHYFENGRISDFIVKPPFVLGHEAGGVVVEVGADVKHLKAGDKVALEPGKTCGHCEFCRTGRYNLCPDVIFFATPPVDGVFQEYVAHEADLCFKIPDEMDTMEAALIEPLAVGFHAAQTGGAHLGQTALITGSGCIGLVSMMSAKALGVSRVFVSDVVDKRLQKAKSLGATEIINGADKDVVKTVAQLTGGAGVDLVIETSGTEIAANQGIAALKKGGTLVFVGYSKSGMMNLAIGSALDKELTMKTIFRYRHIYPLAIDAVSRGLVDIKNIVTNVFEFDDIQKGMTESIHNKAEIVKSVIRIGK
ncbi:NAD(P)-dependent alcohol dehydrogenase [Leadbettera azotonutricia]|uniref:Sorbitol dehydrogenase (L-iditol 2-dehydrogenase)(Glucitol dehydrogenase) n=1 Tax=Leadbettera azotonutricia (strain ATCC BAA-888 / DSM 13862 / ZAS-9) TaxID=545695 RepID=F5YAG3_LEAAZ|nr:NAD(P)-dependent alcohol dehydrogenase [Leadbettera azotonutricia]AEF82839.1 sorbitol dehydrogenase (L-iditol 2-dehydrogenase)(Glucitol dehydrogenase) [Leadbettera azotonutricia ZAS-9]